MNGEEVFNGISGIRDDIIEEAETHAFTRPRAALWKRGAAIAAALAVLLTGAFALKALLGGASAPGGNAGGGAEEGYTYMSYAGPVLPLTALSGGERLTAERRVDFDFSPYATRVESYEMNGETRTYETYDTAAVVIDAYTLTNTSAEDVTATLLYPFAASLFDELTALPQITADGETVAAELFAGPYSGGFRDMGNGGRWNIANLDSWEMYDALLSDGAYLGRALDSFPTLDIPVTVYELTDAVRPETDAANPTLRMEFSVDYSTVTVMSYGTNGGGSDEENGLGYRQFSVPEEFNSDYGTSRYVILMGGDLGGYTLKGYTDGGCETELEGVSATVTRYETTLDDALSRIYYDNELTFTNMYGADEAKLVTAVPKETYLGLVKELMCDFGALAEEPAERYRFFMLEDVFSETRTMKRVMYLRFDVTVPAGGSVELSARMVKEASRDFIGENQNRNGYDMMTTLASSFEFTRQTASVSHTEHIEIAAQSFGFDIENGVTEVELDAAAEKHYWLEVTKRAAE